MVYIATVDMCGVFSVFATAEVATREARANMAMTVFTEVSPD
jgi:hypothetical protein